MCPEVRLGGLSHFYGASIGQGSPDGTVGNISVPHTLTGRGAVGEGSVLGEAQEVHNYRACDQDPICAALKGWKSPARKKPAPVCLQFPQPVGHAVLLVRHPNTRYN